LIEPTPTTIEQIVRPFRTPISRELPKERL
jgi:hypothetical protein